jgi:hypothetical protein
MNYLLALEVRVLIRLRRYDLRLDLDAIAVQSAALLHFVSALLLRDFCGRGLVRALALPLLSD